jgi:hypothetical protein
MESLSRRVFGWSFIALLPGGAWTAGVLPANAGGW